MTKSLLEQSASFFYADDAKTLATQVAAAIGTALSKADQILIGKDLEFI
jgi:ethanolamine utilization microcompartment shell protein EutL